MERTDTQLVAKTLGLESGYGYHIEVAPASQLDGLLRDPAPAPSGPLTYPCIEEDLTYTGCLGLACPLQTCWSGAPTPGHLAELRQRLHPGDWAQVPRALCPDCAHVAPVAIVVRREDPAPLLRCARGRWVDPINGLALARRRIPAEVPAELAVCPDFVSTPETRPEVARYRQENAMRVRAHRLARDGCGEEG